MKTLVASLVLVFASAATSAMARCSDGSLPPCPGGDNPDVWVTDDPTAQALGITDFQLTPYGVDFFREQGDRLEQTGTAVWHGINGDRQIEMDYYYKTGVPLRIRFIGTVAVDFNVPIITATNTDGQSRVYVGDASTSPPHWVITRGADVPIPDLLLQVSGIIVGTIPPAIHDRAITTGVIEQGMLCEGCYTDSMFCSAEWRCCQDCYNYRTGGLPFGGTPSCGPFDQATEDPIAPAALCGGTRRFSCSGIERSTFASGATRSRAKTILKNYLNQDCRNDLCGGCCSFTDPDCLCLQGDFFCFCSGRGTPCTSP